MDEFGPILEFISRYGYWIAVPLMILEGPIVTIVMGFFASLGLFNIFVVILFSTSADLLSDAFYYLIGKYMGPPILKRFGVPNGRNHENLRKMKRRFDRHPGKIFFSAKVFTGIAHGTFVLSGVTRVKYWKVLKYSFLGGVIWSSALAFIGFFFGRRATNVSRILSRAGIIIFCLFIVFLILEFWLGKRLTKKFAVWRKGFNNGNNGNLQDQISEEGEDEN